MKILENFNMDFIWMSRSKSSKKTIDNQNVTVKMFKKLLESAQFLDILGISIAVEYKKIKLFLLCSALIICSIATSQSTFTDRSDLLNNSEFSSGLPLGVCDMDNDGLDDIIRVGGRQLEIEYQQENNEFERHALGEVLDNVAVEGMVISDVDQNGYMDIVLGGYYNGISYFASENQRGMFNHSKLNGPEIFLQNINFIDINNDGDLDLFACHDEGLSSIYINENGSLNYDMSLLNPESTIPSDNSGNYGSIWTDYDNDGDQDLYISKCRLGVLDPQDARRINLLFRNDNEEGFKEVALDAGLVPYKQSWVTAFEDINNDGLMDAIILNHINSFEEDFPLLIYLNNGNGTYTLTPEFLTITSDIPRFGFQLVAEDFNNDGFIDLLITDGGTQDAVLLLNDSGERFEIQTESHFVGTKVRITSAASGDLNNDGFIDLITSLNGSPDRLFVNNGNDNHWIKIILNGSSSNLHGIGARLELYGEWGVQIREVRAGESYGTMNSLTTHFGLKEAEEIDSLIIKWPSGNVQRIDSPSIDQLITIEEMGGVLGIDPFSADNITYQVTSIAPNTVMAIDYNITGGTTVSIPETVDNGPNTYTVTSIGINAFQNNQLTSVTIPNSVTSIGASAFQNNQLTSVSIPNGVTSIGEAAFFQNDMTKVTIPENVTDLGPSAFNSNPITKVTALGTDIIPAIADNTFSNRNQIDLVVPEGKGQDYLDNGWTGFKSISEAVTFTIDPIADATIDENTAYTGPVPTLSGDTPVGNLTYTLGGTDAGLFTIDPATGQVSMVARDFEAPVDANTDNIYELSITATDDNSNSASQAWTVTIEDVNETISFTINAIAAISIDENTAYTGPVPTLSGDTPVGNLTYTLGGTDAGLFTIDPATGQVSMIARDFEAPVDANTDNIYELGITATDDNSNSASQVWTVTIEDVNETVSVTFTIDPITNATIDENTAYTGPVPTLSGDTPVGNLTYTLGGTDAGLFTIDPATGQVSMIARDYEAPVDVNTDNIYELSITATDDGSNSASQAWTVTIEDVNEIANDALRVLVMTPSCTGSADGSVEVIMDTSGYLMDILIEGDTMENRFFDDIASGTNFEIDGLGVGNYTVTVTIPEISFERTFGVTVNEIGSVSGKRESLDFKQAKATYVVSGSDRYEVSVNGEKMDFVFGDTGPQRIELEQLYGRTDVVISGRNDCQGKVTDSFFMHSVLAEVYPTMTSSFVTILTGSDHLDVRVHTLAGRLVKEARFTERENRMDLSFLESGVYILKMASKRKGQTIKIIKR